MWGHVQFQGIAPIWYMDHLKGHVVPKCPPPSSQRLPNFSDHLSKLVVVLNHVKALLPRLPSGTSWGAQEGHIGSPVMSLLHITTSMTFQLGPQAPRGRKFCVLHHPRLISQLVSPSGLGYDCRVFGLLCQRLGYVDAVWLESPFCCDAADTRRRELMRRTPSRITLKSFDPHSQQMHVCYHSR